MVKARKAGEEGVIDSQSLPSDGGDVKCVVDSHFKIPYRRLPFVL